MHIALWPRASRRSTQHPSSHTQPIRIERPNGSSHIMTRAPIHMSSIELPPCLTTEQPIRTRGLLPGQRGGSIELSCGHTWQVNRWLWLGTIRLELMPSTTSRWHSTTELCPPHGPIRQPDRLTDWR